MVHHQSHAKTFCVGRAGYTRGYTELDYESQHFYYIIINLRTITAKFLIRINRFLIQGIDVIEYVM